MNQQLKTFLIILAAIFIGGASIAYGALTAPTPQQPAVSVQKASPKITKESLDIKLKQELPTITTVLTTAYPKATIDYTMIKSQLFGEGEWFGALLSYHGTDTLNRDTLRVIMQKKDGAWILRTTPPEIILSAKKYPDVPKSILQTINKPVSLP
ncbi:MAG: hypothetical protein WAW80_04960 [Candidatus Saccharimonadales bacterium]